MKTELSTQRLEAIHKEGLARASEGPISDRRRYGQVREIIKERGRDWVESVMSLSDHRFQSMTAQELKDGRTHILLLADRAEAGGGHVRARSAERRRGEDSPHPPTPAETC